MTAARAHRSPEALAAGTFDRAAWTERAGAFRSATKRGGRGYVVGGREAR
jgi:hypothetical protein